MPNLTTIIFALIILLSAPLTWAQTVVLEWTQNTEADMAGYEIWRQLVPCPADNSTAGLTVLGKVGLVGTYTDTTLPPKTRAVCYAIKAFDTSQNFSPFSNLAGKVFPRPDPVLIGHWQKKTDVPHAADQNLKYYTIHALVNPKAPLIGFNPILVKNYTYFFYASINGYCGAGGVLAGHGSTGRICDPTPLEPLKWTSLTATYDGTTLSIYKNKTLIASGPQAPPADSTDLLQIGGSKFNEICNCDLEVWLYDQAMTSAEVIGLPVMPTTPAMIAASPSTVAFTSVMNGANPPVQTIAIANAGTGVLAWTASSTQPWLTVTPSEGIGAGTITVSVARDMLPVGTHLASILIQAPGATDVSIPVTYSVTPDLTPPSAPTELRVVERPTAGSVTLAWTQPQSANQPASTRIDRLNTTTNTWVALKSVLFPETKATVSLAPSGRRIFRACGVWNGADLCATKEGVWVTR